MNHSSIIYTIVGTLIVVAILAGVYTFMQSGSSRGTPEELSTLASCLSESGAKFYGAFWCSHCQQQKAAFGSAVKELPYVECSTPDGRGQTDVCAEAEITGYPTWEFADGTRVSGEQTPANLATYSGCPAPTVPESPESNV